jgi:hypothetical protein
MPIQPYSAQTVLIDVNSLRGSRKGVADCGLHRDDSVQRSDGLRRRLVTPPKTRMTICAGNNQTGANPQCNPFNLLDGVSIFGGHQFGRQNAMAGQPRPDIPDSRQHRCAISLVLDNFDKCNFGGFTKERQSLTARPASAVSFQATTTLRKFSQSPDPGLENDHAARNSPSSSFSRLLTAAHPCPINLWAISPQVK